MMRSTVAIILVALCLMSGAGLEKGEKVTLPLKSVNRMVVVEATAYAPPLFPKGQLTFCETPVGWGTIAVDPRFLPLGSKVRIRDLKTKTYLFEGQEFTALDTGRLIKGAIIDIWMPSYSQAINWGRRLVIIEIITAQNPGQFSFILSLV